MASKLFSPYALAGSVVARNRIVLSPMCQYSAVDGVPQEWHHTNLVTRAVGGCGVIIAEASSVAAVGRISPADTGIWSKAQVDAWTPITAAIAANGAVPGIQIAHAGRKVRAAGTRHCMLVHTRGQWGLPFNHRPTNSRLLSHHVTGRHVPAVARARRPAGAAGRRRLGGGGPISAGV